MPTIILQLDPNHLTNPDLDLRYLLPALLEQKTNHLVQDDAYDYVGTPPNTIMLLFFQTAAPQLALQKILQILKTERPLHNDLSQIPIALHDNNQLTVLHPPNFAGKFHYP
jgi:hypothetical protein